MRANDIFNIKLNICDELCIFTGRILFWWEEQNIKIESLYEEKDTKKLMIENSKVFIKTINKFLISVKTEKRTIDKKYLYKISMEKDKNMEWSDILHYSIVVPLYQAYINVSGSSINKMKEFRKNVLAVYDKGLRINGFEDFPLPPELIEYDFLSTNGVLTRDDLLKMSYAEILKYQTIREIEKRYKNQNNNQIQNNKPNDKFKEFFSDVII